MGKANALMAASLVGLTSLFPHRAAYAQSAPTASCATPASLSPGHYTGTWQSSADYQFDVFGTALHLENTITGTLDLTVGSDGHVSGTASGNVDAPITDYGNRHDISSGYGTISGPVSGVFSSGSSLLVLAAPVIDMHWGTFGGSAVEEDITMPDYQLAVSTSDCVSASGTSSEQNFPPMNIVPDGTNLAPVNLPGIGTASGSWQITSDEAAAFHDLSQQITSFTSAVNGLLSGPVSSLTPEAIQSTIVEPFQSLQRAVAQHPDLVRCLDAELNAWSASALPQIYSLALQLSRNGDLTSQRAAFDLLRAAQLLSAGCQVPDAGVPAQMADRLDGLLQDNLAARTWAQSASQGVSDRATLLDIARVADAMGDETDSAAILSRLPAAPHVQTHKGRRKHRKHPKRASTTSAPTAGPTLSTGVAAMSLTVDSSATPTFSWKPITGASNYVVVVLGSDGAPVWSWSGGGLTATFGDATLDGVAGTGDSWPAELPSGGYTISVFALNSAGAIAAAALRIAISGR